MSEIRTYRHTGSTFVPAIPERKPITLTTIDAHPMATAERLPPMAHTGHARQVDDAVSHAKASLIISAAYIAAAGMITVGLLAVVWLFRGLGDALAPYAYVGLILWGCAVLLALWSNRRQGLWHSPSGIAHHEIESRERIAREAMQTHAQLLLTRWQIERRDHDAR